MYKVLLISLILLEERKIKLLYFWNDNEYNNEKQFSHLSLFNAQ